MATTPQNGFELDVLLDFGSERWGLELEQTSAPSSAALGCEAATKDVCQ